MGQYNRTNNFGNRGFGRSNDSGGRFGRDRPRGGRSNNEVTNVICAKCGRECDIPFKPTSDRPVYCRDCFRQTPPEGGRSRDRRDSRDRSDFRPRENRDRNDSPNNNSEQRQGSLSQKLDEINHKLDIILQAMSEDPDEDFEEESDEETEEENSTEDSNEENQESNENQEESEEKEE